MAVSTDNAFSGPYLANGVTTVFPFTFTAPTAAEVGVLVLSPAGEQVAPGTYTVSLNPGAGGNVTFSVAPLSGYSVTPLLSPSFTQDLNFEDGSAWMASPVNEGYDRSAARDQYLKREVKRGIKVPLGEDELHLPAAASRAGQFPWFTATGDLVMASGTGSDPALRMDLATPSAGKGAAIVALLDGTTGQQAFDRREISLPDLPALKALALNASGQAVALTLRDRGRFIPTTTPQDPAAEDVTWAEDAGGTVWAKPADRNPTIESIGIVPHRQFDANGVPIGTLPTDHAARLNVVADKLSAWGGGSIRASGDPGAIVLESSLILPIGVSLDLGVARKRPVKNSVVQWEDAVSVMPHPAGVFYTGAAVNQTTSVAANGHCQTGYLLFANMDPRVSVTDYQYAGGIPDIGNCRIENLRVYGKATGGISILRSAGRVHACEWAGDDVATAFSRITSLYTDKMRLESFNFYTRANNTSPLIDTRGTGDALIIDQIECGYWNNGSTLVPAEGVWASNCRGGGTGRLINGIHRFTRSIADVWGIHSEGGQIVLDGFQGRLRDCWFANGGGMLVPVVIRNTSSGTDRYAMSFGGLRFAHQMNWVAHGATGWSETEQLDILLDTGGGAMDITDEGTSVRMATLNGQLDKVNVFAPRIGDSTGPYTDLVRYGAMLQRKPMRITAGKAPVTGVMEISGTLGNTTTATITPTSAGATFKGGTGDWYFQTVLMFDDAHKIGRGITGSPGPVTTPTVQGSTNFPLLRFDLTQMPANGGFNVRVYAEFVAGGGAATGNFGFYVDLPAFSLREAIFDGKCLASFPLIARAPGPIDTMNAQMTGVDARLVYESGILTAKGASATTAATLRPSVGTWKVGDRVEARPFAADGNNMALEASVCRTAGAPSAATFDPRYASTVSPAT